MPWIQLKINTTGNDAETLSDALIDSGAVSVTFLDTHDNPVFEPLPGETLLWGDTDAIGLYDAETDMAAVVAMLENEPLLGKGFAHKIEQLEDKDWRSEEHTSELQSHRDLHSFPTRRLFRSMTRKRIWPPWSPCWKTNRCWAKVLHIKSSNWKTKTGDRKSTRLNSSHTEIYTLSLHDGSSDL